MKFFKVKDLVLLQMQLISLNCLSPEISTVANPILKMMKAVCISNCNLPLCNNSYQFYSRVAIPTNPHVHGDKNGLSWAQAQYPKSNS